MLTILPKLQHHNPNLSTEVKMMRYIIIIVTFTFYFNFVMSLIKNIVC